MGRVHLRGDRKDVENEWCSKENAIVFCVLSLMLVLVLVLVLRLSDSVLVLLCVLFFLLLGCIKVSNLIIVCSFR